jgi:UDP-N-acetylglucosamine--N-acetylmuramyl-(pentapeptide) pyrophosphoryl-undecaprenol N-acetylglucosamine transferase
MKQSLKIMISGGGTGGHVFPAIAIANAIKLARPNTEFLFVGAKGKMEMEKVPQAGYNIEGLWISGIQRSLSAKNLLFPIKLLVSMVKANSLVNKFKPDAVIGVGGYASGPVLRVAAAKGIPTLIHEANSYPGIANKLLASKVDKICVAFAGMEKYFPKEKLIITGNPVRKEVVNLEGKREKALDFFKLRPNKKTILVVGGSLGARTINQSIAKDLQLFKKNGIQLIWQTGKLFAEEAKLALVDLGYSGAVTHPFITKMDYAYAAADLIISRAGAMAISELCLVGKPAIFVPSPNVAEDHQTKNALTLVSSQAALMVKDSEAKEILVKTAIELIQNEEASEKLATTIQSLGLRDVSSTIANLVINLIKDKKVE